MTTPWTREHDRLIAERCEGLIVNHEPTPSTPELYTCWPPGKPVEWRKLYRYNIEITYAIRAAEAWRKDVYGRYFHIASPFEEKDGFEATLIFASYEIVDDRYPSDIASTPAEALARALLKAIAPAQSPAADAPAHPET